jgi:hypothetical protein
MFKTNHNNKKTLYNNTAKIERKTSVSISFVNQYNDNRYNTRQQYVRIINRRKNFQKNKEYYKTC